MKRNRTPVARAAIALLHHSASGAILDPGSLRGLVVKEIAPRRGSSRANDPGSIPAPFFFLYFSFISLHFRKKTSRYLDISVMYWNLNTSSYETARYGRHVYEALIRAGKRGVKIRIAQDGASNLSDNEESAYLMREGLAEVREINVTRLIGSGIIHTKFILSDISTLYIGSANMDWKSLSEVKELGVVVKECPCVASDLYKIFAAYWKLGENESSIPEKWPISYRPAFNFSSMAKMELDGEPAEFFISVRGENCEVWKKFETFHEK